MKFWYWLVGVISLAGISATTTVLVYWNPYLSGLLVLAVMSFLIRDMFIEMGRDIVYSVGRKICGKKKK